MITIIFLGIFVIVGFFDCMKELRALRARRRYKDVLFEWVEQPSSRIHDLCTSIGLTIHGLSITIIGLLVFTMLAFFPHSDAIFFWRLDSVQSVLAAGLLGVSIAVIGFWWGIIVFFPIARIVGGNCHYAITGDGMLFAGRLFAWNTFSHFSFDIEQGIILIWSIPLPKVEFALKPPSLDSTSKILEILQNHLPISNRKPVARYKFPILMACICIPAVIFVILTFWLPIVAALLIDAFILYILMYIMGRSYGLVPLAQLDEQLS